MPCVTERKAGGGNALTQLDDQVDGSVRYATHPIHANRLTDSLETVFASEDGIELAPGFNQSDARDNARRQRQFRQHG